MRVLHKSLLLLNIENYLNKMIFGKQYPVYTARTLYRSSTFHTSISTRVGPMILYCNTLVLQHCQHIVISIILI